MADAYYPIYSRSLQRKKGWGGVAGMGGEDLGLHTSVMGPAVAAVTEAPTALGLSGLASCARGG